jgi:hypothetical protein
MGYSRQSALPVTEPVSLTQAKLFLGLPTGTGPQDALITGFIQAAREYGETMTSRSLAQRPYVQVLDSFPFYADTIQSQLAFPPSYYSLPRYSTTLWNYSQMIKLSPSPVISVQSINYIGTDGNEYTLNQDVDFGLDRISEPARIFPPVGDYWPPCLYVNDAVEINFTVGYDPNPAATDTHDVEASPPNQQPVSTIVTGIPQMIILGILNLVAFWFNNRGSAGEIPAGIAQIFLNNASWDFAPTRG